MKNQRYSNPQLFEAFIKSAQYLVRLKTQQDVWDHLGKFIMTYFPADWTALVQRDPVSGVSVCHCTLPQEAAAQIIRTNEVNTLIADVLDSGFFASQTILTPSPSMTVFLPIAEEHKVILIGHKTSEPLPKELLNIYIAIAGLAGTTYERLRAEEALQLANAYNRTLLEASLDPLVTIGSDGKITDVNAATEIVTGYTRDRLIGTSFSDYFTDSEKAEAGYQRVFREGTIRDYPLEVKHQDGHITPVLYNASVYKDETGKVIGIFAAARDVTERKRAEEALALQARHASLGGDVGMELTKGDTLRTILQGCAEAIVRRLEGAFARIWTVNRAGDMLELQASAGLYTHIDGPSARVSLNTDRKIALIARTREPHLTNSVIGDSLIIHQEWAIKECMVSFAGYPLVIENRVIGVMALFSRKPLPEVTLSALASIADGISIGIERLRVNGEIKKLNDELEQRVVERTAELTAVNSELEAFTYSVSHDLRAPLRHIHGFVDLLNQNSSRDLDDKGKRYLKNISEAASQMGNLVDDLLSFSRMGRTEIKKIPINLGNIIYGVINEMKGDLKDRSIEWKIEKLEPVYGDPSMLRLVIVNLIANAIKFTRTKDKAVIEIGSYAEAGENVVYVKDNGVGFDMRYVDKLFGVFQRLHSAAEFEGTGIGLANIRRIVGRHGGRTWAESALGEGAAFYFSLPSIKKDNV
ncbi:MAG: PAS domain S-box protein [Nitrospirota bacterium]